MFTLHYDPMFRGTMYPDGEIEGAVNAFLLYPNLTFTTGQELLVTAFRVAIKEGRLDSNNFVLVLDGDGTVCYFDKDGRTEDYIQPSVNENLLVRLL